MKDGTTGVVLNFAIHICGDGKEMSILPSTPAVTGNDLRTPVNKGLQKVNALIQDLIFDHIFFLTRKDGGFEDREEGSVLP